jgi:hypothetical protein
MKLFLKAIWIVVFSQVMFLNITMAQQIIPEFPQANQTVTLLDLLDGGLGMRWTDEGNSAGYEIEIQNLSSVNPSTSFFKSSAQSSPYYLSSFLRSVFFSGNYTWLVRTTDGSRSTGAVPFTISSPNIKATPTPNTPPTQPSGDLNGSALIDKPDIYLLASNWKRNLFDPYAADFNLDGDVNQEDLLVLASRFGNAAVPPTPSPIVGLPGNITFFPNDVIGFAELANFKITWETPQYPENVLYYELLIISQFEQEIVSMRFLEKREFNLSSLTQDGTYRVFIRAKTTDGTVGNIASSKFTIDPNRFVTPTPNSGIINLDYNNDGIINEDDSRLFIQAFGTFNGEPNFISGADFNQDGFIDTLDLVVYQANYPNASAETEPPSWNAIIRPIWSNENSPFCQATGTNDTISLTSLDITFPNSTICYLAELYASQFVFSPVDNALDYFYTVYFEGEGDPVLQGFTNGENFFTEFSILEPEATFIVIVQSVNEGLQFSDNSVPLRLTIPIFQNNG